jgi:DNA-binding MarR family transcriptional regulator
MQNIRHGRKSDARIDADARRFRELVIGLSRQASLRDPIAAMCEEAQLTPPQVHAVMWLGLDGPLTMGELARRVGVTEKTITGIVDRLELAAYLERERDREDRRVVRAKLTPRGADVYREIDAHLHQKISGLMRLLDPDDRKALFRILEKLVNRPEAPAAASTESKKP